MSSTDANVTAILNIVLDSLNQGSFPPNVTLPGNFNASAVAEWIGLLNTSNVSLPLLNDSIHSLLDAAKTQVPAAPKDAAAAKAAAEKAFFAYLQNRFYTLQLFILAGYAIMCFLCVALIAYLRFNRSVAFRGDVSAARKIILPAFEPMLVVMGLATGGFVIFVGIALGINLYVYGVPKLTTEVFYSGRQFVFLSIVVFMLQKSVSGPALQRSVVITFVLSTYTLPIVWYMVEYGNMDRFYTVITVARAPMLLVYTYIFIRPPCRASKRTIREYCIYAYIYYGFLFAYNDYFRQNKLDTGFYLTYANILWGSLCPLVIWRVLKADTEHWRGMGQRAVALQSLFRQKKNIPERVSSKGLHVLIEMHRKYIIDFAYLELKQRIGVGASAVVFNGILRSKVPVAVKVYTPSDFTEETVAEFSQEAALCGALNHPNIVKFHGMCVSPPTICLVSELCQGSLEDITVVMARRSNAPNRQQLLINIAYMLDAARAVAYIHSFTPAFLHRDIKPANFLVDADNTVKLTDFGESRSLPRSNIAQNRQQTGFRPNNAASGNNDTVINVKPERESLAMMSGANLQQVRYSERVDPNATRMTIKGTVDYMAPEIVNGKGGQAAYGEAADVYALAITMWDIIYPTQEKYPSANGNHLKIFELVMDGQRPKLDDHVHTHLRGIIESSWQQDPRLRPSAQNVVSILETIQEEVAAAFALELSDEIEHEVIMGKNGQAIEQSFSGEIAVHQMEELHFVSSVSEAIRLGNALMDAGMLHHSKHARPFESTDSMYYFDEENIHLCQPIALGAYDGAPSGKSYKQNDEDTTDECATMLTGTSKGNSRRTRSSRSHSLQGATTIFGSASTHSDHGVIENGICACRKLGQRLAVPKPQPRRRFRRKYKAIAEESILQASLLNDDHIDQPDLLRSSQTNDFDDFDSTVTHAMA
ncbi:hypothetical protein Poli38472_008874 [Pythium oligandrum]|uniref:Protein kinase n=1 Tax=Pythium oligandrum TaxID=41045 RepID=A0A8K1C483_PYTOL|nr:hypothetical protein Poli38472_008874 [Pythium oligandrum]|eukprot:TMW56226.1 hypothetical protein Poli38472_008874 [Pythium oligandrum]